MHRELTFFCVSLFTVCDAADADLCLERGGGGLGGADLSHPRRVRFKTRALSSVFPSSELEILFPPSLPVFHLQRLFFFFFLGL